MTALEAALDLHKSLGCNVIPLQPQSKAPLRQWRAFQLRKLTENDIKTMFENVKNVNLGIVTGRVSNLLVLDADAPNVVKKWGVPVTPIAETARGRHYYFKLPDVRIRSATGLADGLDVRAEGGYVVAPPSIHPTGKPYQWVIPPTEAEPAPCPSWLLELLRKHRARYKSASIAEIAHGVPEGRRNISSAKLIGYLLAHLPPDLWESIAWPLVRGWNQLNHPPLSERDLRYTFDSIARKQRAKSTNDAMAKILLAARENFGSLRKLAEQAGIPKSTLADLYKKYTSSLSQNLTSKKKSLESKGLKPSSRTLLKSKVRTVLDFDPETVREGR